MRLRSWLSELRFLAVLLALPLCLFWPATFGNRTLIPADNLYQWQPYRAFAQQQGVDLPPHNELLSDLVLENLAWKRFIVQSLQAGEVPLWNPYLFAGVPFLAAGQHSALYPLSVLFYVLPLSRAYGLFTVLQLALAGIFMYTFARVLRLRRFPALVAGITYQLSAFFLVSVVFTMIVAAAAWLPLMLAAIELIARKQEEKGSGPFVPIVYVLLGAVALGLQVLAGHPEILVYSLLVTAGYALVRLILVLRRVRSAKPVLRLVAWLILMAGLGLGLGSIQLIPLIELVTRSFRQGAVTYAEVVGWAYPTRQIATFVVPDFFGNPADHGYFDLVSRQWVAVDRLFWGIKNYVEAGSYAGILPLLLAALAVARAGQSGRDRRHVWIFAGLAVLSLLFVFGTPLYAVLYYGLPGLKQLHSPFRWVFPYTLSIAVLAGYGAGELAPLVRDPAPGTAGKPGAGLRFAFLDPQSVLGWGALVSGVALLLAMMAVFLRPGLFLPVADRLAGALGAGPAVGGRAWLSYQWPHLVALGILLAVSGGLFLFSRRRSGGRPPVWQVLAAVIVAGDLILFGWGFNPAARTEWLEFRPPALEFLDKAAEEGPWRLTTYQVPGDSKTLNANVPWLHGLQDVRGYDSIIPRQYVEYMSTVEQQGELLHNRIAPIYGVQNLSSPLLDLLNVRYVVTEGEIPNRDYALVYEGEVRIYENVDALPRAFALPRAEPVSSAELLSNLGTFDPRQVILLDRDTLPACSPAPPSGEPAWPLQAARVVTYTPNTVFVEIEMPGAGWLLLADSYFPGWKAYRSDPDGQLPAPDLEPAGEVELPIVRADGNFRAVRLEAGAHRVRFVYTPLSFKLGLYGSFLSAVVAFLLLLYWLWGRLYREGADDPVVKRVAKNSLLPMGLQLLNRIVDFAFAMIMLRILAPELAGRFTFAVAFIGYADILVRFGLGTLLTREVAKNRAEGNRYLSTVSLLRGLLWLGSLPLMALAIWLYALAGQMSADIVAAIALFAVGLVFSSLADGVSALFNAYEKMEYPAAIATLIALVRVSLGVLALLVGWGFVGLAAVSVVANFMSLAILSRLLVCHCLRPKLEIDLGLGRWMMVTSFPLMINLLLATVFFRIDVLLLKLMQGDAVVGYYGAAYKYIDGLNIIPAYFTMAIFPLMSRFAAAARDSLLRAHILSLRLLLTIALPVAVGTFLIAEGLIQLLGGAEYLPDSRIALQLIIWFLPLSFINSVTQYLLIAVDQQRFLTWAFLIGVAFNVVANLLVIPTFSYRGSAVVTVLSELALLVPFSYAVRKHLGPLPWVSLFWRPAVASAVMGGVLWVLRSLPWPLLIPIGAVVYAAVLVLVGGLRQPDLYLLYGLIPSRRLRSWLPRVTEAKGP